MADAARISTAQLWSSKQPSRREACALAATLAALAAPTHAVGEADAPGPVPKASSATSRQERIAAHPARAAAMEKAQRDGTAPEGDERYGMDKKPAPAVEMTPEQCRAAEQARKDKVQLARAKGELPTAGEGPPTPKP